MTKRGKFSRDEDAYLVLHYGQKSYPEMAVDLNRHKDGIRRRCLLLNKSEQTQRDIDQRNWARRFSCSSWSQAMHEHKRLKWGRLYPGCANKTEAMICLWLRNHEEPQTRKQITRGIGYRTNSVHWVNRTLKILVKDNIIVQDKSDGSTVYKVAMRPTIKQSNYGA